MIGVRKNKHRNCYWVTFAALALVAGSGCCMSSSATAIPAYRMPPELLPLSRSAMVPIDFTLLRQSKPPEHVIAPRDVLGVYIQDIVPSVNNRAEPTVLNVPVVTAQDYYPPRGLIVSPAVGLPMDVALNGTLSVPLVEPVSVDGLTLAQASEKIRRAYSVDRKILEPGHERILISLIRPRVERVLVVRDDIPFGPTFQPQGGAALLTRKGTGQVIDLPAYENDVMHALAATGGLPGVDAFSAVWIFRTRSPEGMEEFKRRVEAGESPEGVFDHAKTQRTAIRIPLRVYPNQPVPFAQSDVILQAGDVVYLETRQSEYFYSGGLLPAGQVPMPRDYDLDVLGAVALASAPVGGPAGGQLALAYNFKGIYSPGAIIPPTRVLILRKLPNGEQVQIRVDLKKALHDQRERIVIAPNDFVMLYYKPGEVAGNYVINLLTFNVASIVGLSK